MKKTAMDRMKQASLAGVAMICVLAGGWLGALLQTAQSAPEAPTASAARQNPAPPHAWLSLPINHPDSRSWLGNAPQPQTPRFTPPAMPERASAWEWARYKSELALFKQSELLYALAPNCFALYNRDDGSVSLSFSAANASCSNEDLDRLSKASSGARAYAFNARSTQDSSLQAGAAYALLSRANQALDADHEQPAPTEIQINAAKLAWDTAIQGAAVRAAQSAQMAQASFPDCQDLSSSASMSQFAACAARGAAEAAELRQKYAPTSAELLQGISAENKALAAGSDTEQARLGGALALAALPAMSPAKAAQWELAKDIQEAMTREAREKIAGR